MATLDELQTQLANLQLVKAQSDNFLAVLVGGPLPAGLPAPLPLAAQSRPPALSAGLAWFDLMRTARGTANMIQGQRDFFGLHGFQRLDGLPLPHGTWAPQSK